jgi:hypothetical protein
MTIYNVHLYREMRLKFDGIEAETPEAAAAIVRDKLTSDADDIEDCEGENLAALVDLAGDKDYSQSVTIDFAAERIRKAAHKLLAALESLADQADEDCPEEHRSRHFKDALDEARAAIAEAKAAGGPSDPAEIDVHALLAARRQIACIWSIEDVQEVRPDLTDEQAWEVLQQAGRRNDAETGINWTVLECHAGMLHGDAPETDEEEGGGHE